MSRRITFCSAGRIRRADRNASRRRSGVLRRFLPAAGGGSSRRPRCQPRRRKAAAGGRAAPMRSACRCKAFAQSPRRRLPKLAPSSEPRAGSRPSRRYRRSERRGRPRFRAAPAMRRAPSRLARPDAMRDEPPAPGLLDHPAPRVVQWTDQSRSAGLRYHARARGPRAARRADGDLRRATPCGRSIWSRRAPRSSRSTATTDSARPGSGCARCRARPPRRSTR